jgi:hypothetical protein
VQPADLKDPRLFLRFLWPDVNLYDRQWEIVDSVIRHHETTCVAGSMLGKDFVSAFLVLWFFLTRQPCRVVTTSVDHAQLENVLWGEMRRFISTARHPLEHHQGGPLVCNHLHLRRQLAGKLDPLSYVVGRVAKQGEGILGHHLPPGPGGEPRTLFLADEASAIDNQTYDAADTWAHRELLIGNPWPTSNRFREAVRLGSSPPHRHVLRIRATDSPNVRLALGQRRQGLPVTGETLVPGVLSWPEYQRRRAVWDDVRQTICLDAEFCESREALLFPPLSLDAAGERADLLAARPRRPRAMGVDSGEGRSYSCWAVGDHHGLIDLVSIQTPDTVEVVRQTLALMKKYHLDAESVAFDRGGGGKQHADRLRALGYDVETVAFGSASDDERGVYLNRRAQMYGELSLRVAEGWAIPAQYRELRRQLSVMPRRLDQEGRLVLPPKAGGPDSLEAVLGRSPDEADAVALCCHRLNRPVAMAGALC